MKTIHHKGADWELKSTGLGHSEVVGIPPGGQLPQTTHWGVSIKRLPSGPELLEYVSKPDIKDVSEDELRSAIDRALQGVGR